MSKPRSGEELRMDFRNDHRVRALTFAVAFTTSSMTSAETNGMHESSAIHNPQITRATDSMASSFRARPGIPASANTLGVSRKFRDCTVDLVKRDGVAGEYALVKFTDDSNQQHSGLVPWSSSLRRKLEKAKRNGSLVDIKMNTDGQITYVR